MSSCSTVYVEEKTDKGWKCINFLTRAGKKTNVVEGASYLSQALSVFTSILTDKDKENFDFDFYGESYKKLLDEDESSFDSIVTKIEGYDFEQLKKEANLDFELSGFVKKKNIERFKKGLIDELYSDDNKKKDDNEYFEWINPYGKLRYLKETISNLTYICNQNNNYEFSTAQLRLIIIK